MAASFTAIQGMFKQRYGNWIEPLPDIHTLADKGTFIPGENRPGLGYNFPVLTGIEHGQTANVDNSAFPINPAIDSEVLNANLDGATILIQAVVSYDTIYKSLNGTGNGSSGGAFKTALDQMVQAMLLGGNLYRELALAYGPGTSTAVASNIGAITANVTGGAFPGSKTVRLSEASWISGLWIVARNMLVDIYQADGLTPRELGVTVTNRVNTTQTRIVLTKGSGTGTIAAGDVLVPFGWRTKSCFGIEAIYNNTTTLFGINAAVVAPWQCQIFPAGGQLTRAKILGYCAQISVNGVDSGGDLFVSAPTFADLAEETAQLQRYTANTDKTKRQGASELMYETACGDVRIVVYTLQKQGQAFFIANDNFRRVGSTDLTMKPIGGGAEGFFTHLTTNAGAQMKVFSNQAPVFEIPYRNFMINGIVNSANSGRIVDA
jgi:hypothetical protein